MMSSPLAGARPMSGPDPTHAAEKPLGGRGLALSTAVCADGLRCSQTSESAELLQIKMLITSLAPRISLKASEVNAGQELTSLRISSLSDDS